MALYKTHYDEAMIHKHIWGRRLTLARVLAILTDSAPASVQMETATRLQQLNDVELVVVLRDIGLVEHAIIVLVHGHVRKPFVQIYHKNKKKNQTKRKENKAKINKK